MIGGDVTLTVFVLGNVIESIMSAAAGSGSKDDFPVLGAEHALFGIDQGLFVFGPQDEVVVVLVIDEVEFIHRREFGAFDIFHAELDEGKSGFGEKWSRFCLAAIAEPRRQAILQPEAKIVSGYELGMASYAGVLSESELKSVILYIQSLK